MRVLFNIYPNSRAHLFPMVPLAWALQSAGHEVRIASHASSVELVMSTGLTPVALGEGLPAVRETPDCDPPKTPDEVDLYPHAMGLGSEEREHWIKFYQYLFPPISDYVRVDRPDAGELVDFARGWRPDLVIWDPVSPAGAVAARACGAAHARLTPGQDVLAWSLERLAEHSGKLQAAGLDDNPLATKLRPLAERYGFEVDEELLLGQWTVDIMPEGLCLPTNTLKLYMRHVPYAGGEPFPKWLYERPERPRVAMSLGESTRRFISGDWDRTPRIMQAIDGLDVEVVATLDKVQLNDVTRLPDNVQTADWVNLLHLLPTCSSIIHHGGVGTYAAAVATRTPQLVCDLPNVSTMMLLVADEPQAASTGTYRVGFEFSSDQGAPPPPTSHWELPAKKLESTPVAEYVIAQRAGERLDHRAQSIEEMRELIQRVTTADSYRAGATALYDQWLATPGPGDLVPVLERMTIERRMR